MGITNHLNNLRIGHICLVLCCICYLIWWSITFNPMKTFPSVPKYILFAGMFIFGLTGGVFLIRTMCKLPNVRGGISNVWIMLSGVIIYFILLYVTNHFLHRQVTTELFLIVGWAVLELCVLSSTYGAEAINIKYLILMALIVVSAAVISLICYLKYYDMEAVKAFYDGMVPIVLFGIVMAVQAGWIR